MNVADAINLWAAELKRRRRKPFTQQSYIRSITRFSIHVGADRDIASITADDIRSWMDVFVDHAESTAGLQHTIMSVFFRFLVLNEHIAKSPVDKVERPWVPPIRDRVRTRITAEQVEALLRECNSWPERLCVFTVAHLAVRRTALAELRWRDIDGKKWTASFLEKGGKRITKPIHPRLQALYTSYAIERSMAGNPIHGDEWVVPNKIDTGRRDKRSPRIVYVLVKDVAARIGVKTHVHAFRSSFAMEYLRKGGSIQVLSQYLGHSSIATTQGYMDPLDSDEVMLTVRNVDYGSQAA